MIWYKAWLESRSRIAWASILVLAMVYLHWRMHDDKSMIAGGATGKLVLFAQAISGAEPGTAAYQAGIWQALFITLAGIAALTIAILLSGSGINTQTFYGMRQGVHPSMIFTLSLPVRRGTWVWARASLGAIETTALILLLLLIPPIFNPIFGTAYSWKAAFLVWPFMTLAALVAYWFSVFLATFLDELWQGLISLSVAGGLIGLALSGTLPQFNWIAFLTGSLYVTSNTIPWGGVLLCLLISAGFHYASVAVIERREF